ncbi:MAG: rhomboid family intramembrane serine protease [Opitutaceae bacterium]|nr:rhomboid family intramembrane serine protease [Opitutaceae bacterium]MBP9911870.1 rhomboid family intramembrane serine protease [Opitutaceae bacterium]
MNRYASRPSDDHQPLTWLNGHAIYAAHYLVVVFVASMLLTTVLMAFKVGFLWSWLPFTSAGVLRGEVWRLFTYGLVNPPSLWFVVDMFMIVWFGRELEKFFGRRIFLRFYICLYLLTPLLYTLIGVWRPMQLVGETGAFALFIAFATLYPNAVMLFNLLAKWVAFILVGLYSLMALSGRDLFGLVSLWVTVGFAYAFVRYEQGALTLPALPRFNNPFRRKPQFRVLPDLPSDHPRTAKQGADEAMAEVDALLDKIARSGFASLTADERAKLEKGRASLLKKDPRKR